LDRLRKIEDEYFVREDTEKIKRLKETMRQEILKSQERAIKKLCHMRCPKCVEALEEVIFRGLKIGRCNSCNGVWLDYSQLKKIARPGVGLGEKTIIAEIIDLFRPH
jgi:hypothetical protein